MNKKSKKMTLDEYIRINFYYSDLKKAVGFLCHIDMEEEAIQSLAISLKSKRSKAEFGLDSAQTWTPSTVAKFGKNRAEELYLYILGCVLTNAEIHQKIVDEAKETLPEHSKEEFGFYRPLEEKLQELGICFKDGLRI